MTDNTLPAQYEYLYYEPGPKMFIIARGFYGIQEVVGPGDNPLIMGWAKEVEAVGYTHDAVAWCGLGQAVCAKRAGWDYKPEGNALWALNWAKWGNSAPGKIAMLGDILVKKRQGGGHVTQYVGEDRDGYYHCLGFNQTDMCNIARIKKSEIVAVRRAPWKIKQPPNVRPIIIDAKGPISIKEN